MIGLYAPGIAVCYQQLVFASFIILLYHVLQVVVAPPLCLSNPSWYGRNYARFLPVCLTIPPALISGSFLVIFLLQVIVLKSLIQCPGLY